MFGRTRLAGQPGGIGGATVASAYSQDTAVSWDGLSVDPRRFSKLVRAPPLRRRRCWCRR